MDRTNKRRAFTIVEMLVVALIMLVILGVIFQLLVPSLSLFKSQMAFSQAHQSALMASRKIKRELSNTGLPTVTMDNTLKAFSFLPRDQSAPFDGAGRPRYANTFIVYYLNSEDKLIRKFYPFGPEVLPPSIFSGPDPGRLTTELLGAAVAGLNGSERVMAARVSHFSIADDGTDPSLIEPPLIMELTCSVPTSTDEIEEYQVRLEVSPRSVGW